MTKEQVASLLRTKRRELGLSGGEVVQSLRAYGVDISAKTLWGYENGVSAPSVQTFLALCRIYGVEDVIGEVKAQDVSGREKELLRYFRAASPELQDAALRMLKPEEKENTASLVG